MTPADWPWQYNFPPFFTIQPNLDTRNKQISAWSSLVLKYFRMNNKYILDIREAESLPLFNNQEIRRSLSSEGILMVLSHLQKQKNAEPTDKNRNRWIVYWHTLEEWANIIYSWASSCGMIGSVCTLYEIVNTADCEFCGMPEEVLISVLKFLENKNLAEIIMLDDSKGVKFF